MVSSSALAERFDMPIWVAMLHVAAAEFFCKSSDPEFDLVLLVLNLDDSEDFFISPLESI